MLTQQLHLLYSLVPVQDLKWTLSVVYSLVVLAATGGYGSVIGTFVGIFVIMLLKTGLPYVGLQANWQQIITGLVLIIAVLIDIVKEKKKAAM